MADNIENTIKISIMFKDTDEVIKFDLKKNTVFYGNNGKGKTRILRAIDSLYSLAKTNDSNSLKAQLSELNLSKLTINNNDYSTLFSEFEKVVSKDNEDLVKFFEKNKQLTDSIFSQISFICDNPIGIMNSGFKIHIINDIRRKKEQAENMLNNNYNIDELLKIFFEIYEMIRFAFDNDSFKTINELYDHVYFNLITSFNSLIHGLQNIRFKGSNSKNKIQSEKDRVLKALGKKGARYLSVNSDIESKNIFEEISKKYQNINNFIITTVWEEDCFDYKNTNNFEKINKEIRSFNEKIKLFNKVISYYNDNIDMLFCNDSIIFQKNNQRIDFNKLSSGEKRLSIIFLNIIFSEEDIILIDEPEISLSLDYQSKIIRDIMNILSKSNKRIMIATHAPFIFEDFIEFPDNDKVEV